MVPPSLHLFFFLPGPITPHLYRVSLLEPGGESMLNNDVCQWREKAFPSPLVPFWPLSLLYSLMECEWEGKGNVDEERIELGGRRRFVQMTQFLTREASLFSTARFALMTGYERGDFFPLGSHSYVDLPFLLLLSERSASSPPTFLLLPLIDCWA